MTMGILGDTYGVNVWAGSQAESSSGAAVTAGGRAGGCSEVAAAAALHAPVQGEDAAGAILPPPLPYAMADIGAAVALLSLRAGRDEQQINQDAEQTQNAVQDAAERAEVKEMVHEASDIQANGLGASLMQVAQGAALVGGASGAPSDQAAAQGASSLCGAGAAYFTANSQAQQQLDQARITAEKAVADSAGNQAGEARQGESDAQSVIKNAIQFYQSMQEAKAQTEQAALHPA